MVQEYELMIILKALLPEDIRANIEKKLSKLVKDFGGKIANTDVWGKKHLAYKINGHDEGYYIVYKLELPADKADELSRELKLFSDILRFMLIKFENQ